MRYSILFSFIFLLLSAKAQLEFTIEGQVVDQSNVQQVDVFHQTPIDVFIRNTSSDTVQWHFGQCRLNDDPNIEQMALNWQQVSDPFGICISSAILTYPCWDLSVSGIEILPDSMAQLRLFFDLFGTGCEAYRFKIIENGTYIDSIEINFCATLSLDENTLNKSLVYPNPASHEINVPTGIEKVMIFDLSGVLVKEERLDLEQIIDVSELSVGAYLIKMEDVVGATFTQEFIVNR